MSRYSRNDAPPGGRERGRLSSRPPLDDHPPREAIWRTRGSAWVQQRWTQTSPREKASQRVGHPPMAPRDALQGGEHHSPSHARNIHSRSCESGRVLRAAARQPPDGHGARAERVTVRAGLRDKLHLAADPVAVARFSGTAALRRRVATGCGSAWSTRSAGPSCGWSGGVGMVEPQHPMPIGENPGGRNVPTWRYLLHSGSLDTVPVVGQVWVR